MERRRRGLLPCPAAPICLHVAIVPDEGVAGFPVNQKIADIKEHVVNEMAFNISQRIGRSQSARIPSSDTASVRSDETDFSDVSCTTTSSAPATGASDHSDGKTPYAKYAKYFETEKDESSEGSTKYTPSLRNDRRRVAISSSFQHRRRRVHTPAPAAYDDSTRDFGSQQPSRSESAPHLDSDGISYRPTVRPRQGSSMASPLLRRARPASCIVEERPDDQEFDNHLGATTGSSETPRRAASSDQLRPKPLFREHVVLPTHRENISMDENRRSVPAQDDPAQHGKYHSEDIKTGNTSNSTVRGRGEPSGLSKQQPGNLKTTENTSSQTPVSTGGEPARHHKTQADYSETRGTSANTVPIHSKPDNRSKQYFHDFKTGSTSSSATQAPAHNEAASNKTAYVDDVKTGKTSTPVSSRPGRRVLPNIPTDATTAETSSGYAGGKKSSASDIRHARHLPRTNTYPSTEGHTSSISHQQKDPNQPKPSHANTSDRNKSGSSFVNFPNTEQQKTHDSKLSSNIRSSRAADSLSNSVRTKQSSSTAGKLHDMGNSKSSVSRTEASAQHSSVLQKSEDSRKFSADSNTSRSKPVAAGGKVPSTERMKYSQQQDAGRSSVPSKSAPKVEPQTSSERKERQSERSAGSEKSPVTDKSRSSKSTGGSGSRLTYKVNAATVQPVLMSSKKTKLNSSDTGRKSSVETSISSDSDVDENLQHSKETMPSESIKPQEQNSDVTASTEHKPSAPLSASSEAHKLDEDNCRLGSSGVNKDQGHGDRQDSKTSVPRFSQSRQSNVDAKTNDQSKGKKFHTHDRLPQQSQPSTDDKTAADTEPAASGNENDKSKKNQQQWHDFMATLHAARAKYSSTDNHSPASETTRLLPVYDNGITPRWRIQRDDFAVPTSIAIAADGSAVIADVANCLLDFIDVEGNIVHSVTGTKPFSVVVSCDNRVYVGDRCSRTVRVFDIYGSDIAQWDADSTSFGWIAGIAMLRNGQLAIIDRERCKVSSTSYISKHNRSEHCRSCAQKSLLIEFHQILYRGIILWS